MAYYVDLRTLSIDSLKKRLKESNLIPSRMLLKERIDERFNCFTNADINNVLDLQKTLKNKLNFAKLAETGSLNEEYLTILLREINSFRPKPNKIRDFSGITSDTIQKLEKSGLKDTVNLFEHVKTPQDRTKLANKTAITISEILELTCLTDLSRIRWVGVSFARVLYDAGFTTVLKVTQADYSDIYNAVTRLNKEKNLYKGQIGLNDMKLLVQAAGEVTLEIEF